MFEMKKASLLQYSHILQAVDYQYFYQYLELMQIQHFLMQEVLCQLQLAKCLHDRQYFLRFHHPLGLCSQLLTSTIALQRDFSLLLLAVLAVTVQENLQVFLLTLLCFDVMISSFRPEEAVRYCYRQLGQDQMSMLVLCGQELLYSACILQVGILTLNNQVGNVPYIL